MSAIAQIADLWPAWQFHAACLGSDPDLFFPERGESTKEAKAICATCPVKAECMEYATSGVEKFGIWGGTSERERRAKRKGMPMPKPKPSAGTHGTDGGYRRHWKRGEQACQPCLEAHRRANEYRGKAS